MRKAKVLINGIEAGVLEALDDGRYRFIYDEDYHDAPISLTMPLNKSVYEFAHFPAFFEGLLPEGAMLDGLLRQYKLDRHDLFAQLIQVGGDLVGAVTVESMS